MLVYRSVRRPKSEDDWYPDPGPNTSITVHESDGSGKDTGVLDHRGNPIMAFNVVGPVGFALNSLKGN